MHEIEEAAIEAANERLARMNLNAPPTAEGQPEQFRTVEQIEADLEAEPSASTPNRSTNAPGLSEPVQPPPTGWHYGTRGASKGKLVRDVAPKPTAAKPKSPAPEPAPAVAPVAFSVPLMLGVDISTTNGQRDVMALVAIWLSDERDDDVAALLASLLRKLVAAEAKLAALATPAV